MADEFICRFCGKPCKNKAGLSAHERMCPRNPESPYYIKDTEDNSKDAKTGKKLSKNPSPKTELPKGEEKQPEKKTIPAFDKVLPLLQQFGIKDGADFSNLIDGMARGMPFYTEMANRIKQIEQNISRLASAVNGLPNVIFSQLNKVSQNQNPAQETPAGTMGQPNTQTQAPAPKSSDDKLAQWFDRGLQLLRLGSGGNSSSAPPPAPPPGEKYKELAEVIGLVKSLQASQPDRGKEIRDDIKIFIEIAKLLSGRGIPAVESSEALRE